MAVRARSRVRTRVSSPGGGRTPPSGNGKTPTPPAYKTTDFMFAMPGLRQANRNLPLATGSATKFAVSLYRYSPSYPVSNYKFFLPSYFVQEANQQEEANSNPYTAEAISLLVGSSNFTAVVNGALMNAANAVVIDPANGPGVWIDVPGTIPANSVINLRIAGAFAAGTAIPVYPRGRTSPGVEACRSHPTDSFADRINSGQAINLAGSSSTNFNGFLFAPVFAVAQGADGRPVAIGFGDSGSYGKGMTESIEPQSVAGIVAMGLQSSTISKQWMLGDTSVAGSGPDIVVSGTPLAKRIAALAMLPNRPFNFMFSQHLNNTDLSDANRVETLMKGVWGKYRSFYPGVPLAQTSMVVRDGTTDGFQTLGNQTVAAVDSTTGTRWIINDWLNNTLGDNVLDYVVNTGKSIQYDATAQNRDKVKLSPNSYHLTRATAAGDTTIYLDGSPSLDAALILDPAGGGTPQCLLVTSVTTITAGSEYQVTMGQGASAATYPAKAIGTLLTESYFGDGTQNPALHMSAKADNLIAVGSFEPFKNQFNTGATYPVVHNSVFSSMFN